jgi:hypothetical protein
MDDTIFYCVNEACARSFPRRVAFCPFCGVRQSAAPASQPAAPPVPAVAPLAEPVMQAAAEAAAEPAARLADARPAGPSAAPPAMPSPEPALASAVTAWVPPPAPAPRAEPERPERADASAERGTANPPLRPPIRMRTWLLALLALAAIWLWAKPRSQDKQVEARVDHAIALTGECRLDAARVELAWLKSSKAKPEQLRRVQSAIGEGGAVCEKKRLRGKAWREAAAGVEHGLSEGAYEQAEHRLAQFTRRWGEDGETRELGGRVAAARGTVLLDEAEACRRKGDSQCMEQRLGAAEGLRRSELAPRAAALRESLASLLRAHKAAPAALAAATLPADVAAAPGADGASAQEAVALPAALESTPPDAIAAAPEPAPLAPVRPPSARAKAPLAVAVIAAPPARARPSAPKAKPAAKPPVALAAAPARVRPKHRPKPPAPQLAARRPAPLVSPTPPALVSRPPAPPASSAPQIFISKPSAMVAAVPAPQYARRLLSDAGHDIELGNYRAAIDKLEICTTMIDAGNRECQALRRRAERLNRDMLRCVASGAEWADEQCQ